MIIGLLHPGRMGESIASALVKAGHDCLWASEGRSQATRERAEASLLQDTITLNSMVQQASVIISVCPPEHAEDLAHQVVINCGFKGTFVDANAIAPTTAGRIGQMVKANGGSFVDGGIIGPPAWKLGEMRLYLSGEHSVRVAALFQGSVVDARAMASSSGCASALKLACAGWTKGRAALLMATNQFAEAQGVRGELQLEWELSHPHLAQASQGRDSIAPKALRFVNEMEQVQAAYGEVNLPGGFHAAAAEIYRRLAPQQAGGSCTDLDVNVNTQTKKRKLVDANE